MGTQSKALSPQDQVDEWDIGLPLESVNMRVPHPFHYPRRGWVPHPFAFLCKRLSTTTIAAKGGSTPHSGAHEFSQNKRRPQAP